MKRLFFLVSVIVLSYSSLFSASRTLYKNGQPVTDVQEIKRAVSEFKERDYFIVSNVVGMVVNLIKLLQADNYPEEKQCSYNFLNGVINLVNSITRSVLTPDQKEELVHEIIMICRNAAHHAPKYQ